MQFFVSVLCLSKLKKLRNGDINFFVRHPFQLFLFKFYCFNKKNLDETGAFIQINK